jgi:hypothetical protein
VADRHTARVSLAIIRAVVEDRPNPVIRILRIDDLFRDEQVLGTTTSPDEAASLIRDWLQSVIARRDDSARADDNGAVTGK